MTTFDASVLYDIVSPLLYWYTGAARVLPWRTDPTPYHVWISEIMLQQTRVEAVKGYYARFLDALPTPAALADADDEVLNKLWQGLGYYSRVRNLKKAAQVICERWGGSLPADREALLALPGIGGYTAGAIASIAFGLPEPAVDGNVLRVVTRLTAYDADVMRQTTKDEITDALRAIYPRIPEEASMLTQAMMELGATLCGPNTKPRCAECPLSDLCRAHRDGRETAYPVRAQKKPRTVVRKTVFLLKCGDAYAIRRRPENGLLAGLWEFPSVDTDLNICDLQKYLTENGFSPDTSDAAVPLPPAKHIFTHIEWHMNGYEIPVTEKPTEFVWATADEIEKIYCIPSAFRAFLKRIPKK